jgi:pimeloyl-ACP methyl ester carboxylesterase
MREGLRLRMGDRPAVRDSELLAAMGDKMLDRIGPRGFRSMFDQFVATTALDLRRCRVPALVVAGADDESLRRPRADALARAMPSATVRLDHDYGHFCHLEQPQRLAAEWAAYLRTVLDVGSHPVVPEGISR